MPGMLSTSAAVASSPVDEQLAMSPAATAETVAPETDRAAVDVVAGKVGLAVGVPCQVDAAGARCAGEARWRGRRRIAGADERRAGNPGGPPTACRADPPATEFDDLRCRCPRSVPSGRRARSACQLLASSRGDLALSAPRSRFAPRRGRRRSKPRSAPVESIDVARAPCWMLSDRGVKPPMSSVASRTPSR